MDRRVTAVALAVSLVPLLACDNTVGTFELVLVSSSVKTDEPLKQRASSLRISAHGPEGTLFEPQTFSTADGSARIPALPVGEGRVITVEGIGLEGDVIVSRARSGPLRVVDGDQSLELFIGRVDRFSKTPAFADGIGVRMSEERAFHSATLLRDGSVLIAGGAKDDAWRPEQGDSPTPTWTIERVDGNSLRFAEVRCAKAGDGPCMTAARIGHSANLLPTGNVLVSGGLSSGDAAAAETEIFGLRDGVFFFGPALQPTPWNHASAATGAGVAIVSGQIGGSEEQAVLTKSSKLYRSQGSGPPFTDLPGLSPARRNFALLRLLDGRLLVSGGMDDQGLPINRLDTLRPSAPQWETPEAKQLGVPRAYHTATLMDDGSVLFIGGLSSGRQATRVIERLDPDGGKVSEAGHLRIGRWAHTTTVLRDGRILVVGGFALNANGSPSQTCELLQLNDDRIINIQTDSACLLHVPRAGHSATLLGSGWVLIAGGVTEVTGDDGATTTPALSDEAEVFVY